MQATTNNNAATNTVNAYIASADCMPQGTYEFANVQISITQLVNMLRDTQQLYNFFAAHFNANYKQFKLENVHQILVNPNVAVCTNENEFTHYTNLHTCNASTITELQANFAVIAQVEDAVTSCVNMHINAC